MGDVAKLSRDTTAAETQFVRTELHAGLTFSKIALHADDQSKIERNRANARKAYDALLRFLPDAILSSEEAKDISSQMARLRADLQQLGEDV